jgi:hypothetical protein
MLSFAVSMYVLSYLYMEDVNLHLKCCSLLSKAAIDSSCLDHPGNSIFALLVTWWTVLQSKRLLAGAWCARGLLVTLR